MELSLLTILHKSGPQVCTYITRVKVCVYIHTSTSTVHTSTLNLRTAVMEFLSLCLNGDIFIEIWSHEVIACVALL